MGLVGANTSWIWNGWNDGNYRDRVWVHIQTITQTHFQKLMIFSLKNHYNWFTWLFWTDASMKCEIGAVFCVRIIVILTALQIYYTNAGSLQNTKFLTLQAHTEPNIKSPFDKIMPKTELSNSFEVWAADRNARVSAGPRRELTVFCKLGISISC